jgi:hypothetical protein
MMDARNYFAQETLKDGLRVTIWAIRPDNGDALPAAFNELEENNVYLRFFGLKQEVSNRELKEATDADLVRTVAVMRCIRNGTGEKIIGAGHYIAVGNVYPVDRTEVQLALRLIRGCGR